MRLYKVEDLKPGMIIGRMILEAGGRILLREGVPLSPEFINALKIKKFEKVFITDPAEKMDIAPPEDVSPVIRIKAFALLQAAYEAIRKEGTDKKLRTDREIIDFCASPAVRAITGPKGLLGKAQEGARMIADEIMSLRTLTGLTSVKCSDTWIYDHSIDVCAMALMLGRLLNFDGVKLRQLATGCLFHDIGMTLVDPAMPEEQRIRLHAKLGYELLRQSDDPDIMMPYPAYEHHEHQDGSGFPRGLKGSNAVERNRNAAPPIPTLVGEICAVANTYDELLSGPRDQKVYMPDEAVGRLQELAGTKLNKELVGLFLQVVPVYPMGMEVVVLDGACSGYRGIVSQVNPLELDMPIVTLIRDDTGAPIDPIEMDTGLECVPIRCLGF